MNTEQIKLSKDFFFGGNATFTIKSEKSGEHRTFKISQMEPNERFPHPAYSLFFLNGPNNETDYSYIGLINKFNGELRFTKKSRYTEDTTVVKIIQWFMKHLFTDGILLNAVVMHEGRCGCCNRKLTEPRSLTVGIGPECRKKLGMVD